MMYIGKIEKVTKKYYQHSIWSEDPKEWIESDEETFNEEVIEFRNQYNLKREIKKNKIIYYFENKTNSAYDWKKEITL